MWAHQEEKFLQKKNDKACVVNYETALLTQISHLKDEDVKLLQIITHTYIANLPAKIFCYYGDHNGCSLECCHYFFKTNLSMEI